MSILIVLGMCLETNSFINPSLAYRLFAIRTAVTEKIENRRLTARDSIVVQPFIVIIKKITIAIATTAGKRKIYMDLNPNSSSCLPTPL